MPIREKLHLSAGYGFEVAIEDEDTITLRRIPQPANRGLVDLLLACPAPFEIPRGTPTTRSLPPCELPRGHECVQRAH